MNFLNFFHFKIEYLALIIIMIFSLSLHEFAHGYVANLLGDFTAKEMGRLTLNPLKHLNLFGSLCMLFFGFGWANPVPVNVKNFSKPKLYMAFVAAAGPLVNLILVFFGLFLVKLYDIFLVNFAKDSLNIFLKCFIGYMVVLNLGLFVFNLIPIPPLDGSRIFMCFFPDNLYYFIMRYEMVGSFLIMFLLWNGSLKNLLSKIVMFLLNIFNFDFVF